jgi:hypothetical protein
LFCWICYIFLWLSPLLLRCPWFAGLIFDGVTEFLSIPFAALESFD